MRTRRMGSVMAIAVLFAGVGMVSAGVLREELKFEDRSVVILLPEHYEKGNDLLPLVLHLHGAHPTFLPGTPLPNHSNPADLKSENSGGRELR